MSTEDIAKAKITPLLHTDRIGRSLEVRDETASTNDDARAASDAGAPDGHVVVADAQTRGRGRQGHPWSSPPGTDLYFSIVLRPPLAARDLPPLTLAVGVAIAEVAEKHAGAHCQVKWPNDVWIAGRKTAGVLVETSTADGRSGPVIVGVGLNVNRREWPEDLRAIATSVAEARGDTLDRAQVLADCLASIEAWIDRLIDSGPAPIIDAVEKRLALRGEHVRVDQLEGELVGLTGTGALRLQTKHGIRELLAGDLQRH